MKKIIALCCLSLAVATQLIAQTKGVDTAITKFVSEAAKGGMMEVNAGKLAAKKGNSTDVKAFGLKMVTDHSKANAQLKAIVALKRWKIAMPSATVTAPDAMLTQSTGKEFDRAYINMMVKDHKKTVALFERAASSNPDPQIKAYAAKTLPILKQHYASIQRIGDKLGIAYDK